MKVRENGATQGSSNDLVRERKEEAEEGKIMQAQLETKVGM